jgi:hypothetical protein
MKTLLVVAAVSLMGCDRVFGLDYVGDRCECDVDAGDCPQRCIPDAGTHDSDGGHGDGALTDAGDDAAIDAGTGCTTNNACSSMVAGTCCVTPGPSTGHCEVGTVLGGGFCYVP